MYFFTDKNPINLIYPRAKNGNFNYKLAKQVLQSIELMFLYGSVLGLNLCLNTANVDWDCWWFSSDPSGKCLHIAL